MPVKKKSFTHAPKKKAPVQVAEKKEELVEKQDRPVMQVVQLDENAVTPPPATPMTPVSSAPEPTTPPVVAPSVVPEASQSVSGDEEKKEGASAAPLVTPDVVSSKEAKPSEESNVVSAAPASLPTPSETFLEGLPEKSSSKKGTILLLVVLLLVLCGAIAGYILVKQGTLKIPANFSVSTLLGAKKATPTPSKPVVPTIVVTPTPVPLSASDKAKYDIQVLNGSGISGLAAKAKADLTTSGFAVSSTGNADTANHTKTEISVKASVPQAFVDALRVELGKTYVVSAVVTVLPAQSDSDVVVTLGSQTAQ